MFWIINQYVSYSRQSVKNNKSGYKNTKIKNLKGANQKLGLSLKLYNNERKSIIRSEKTRKKIIAIVFKNMPKINRYKKTLLQL